MDSRPPAAPGTPARSDETDVAPRRQAHEEVAEIGARVEEIVASPPDPTPIRRQGPADDCDQARPVEEASKHILLGPALATADRLQSRLGKMLVHRGLVTQAELDRALERQGETGERLGEALVAIDAVASGDVARVLAEHLRLPYIDLGDDVADMTLVGAISAAAARRYVVLPVARWGDRIVIAMANPNDAEIVEEVRRLVDAPVVVAVADPVVLRPADRCCVRKSREGRRLPDHADRTRKRRRAVARARGDRCVHLPGLSASADVAGGAMGHDRSQPRSRPLLRVGRRARRRQTCPRLPAELTRRAICPAHTCCVRVAACRGLPNRFP